MSCFYGPFLCSCSHGSQQSCSASSERINDENQLERQHRQISLTFFFHARPYQNLSKHNNFVVQESNREIAELNSKLLMVGVLLTSRRAAAIRAAKIRLLQKAGLRCGDEETSS